MSKPHLIIESGLDANRTIVIPESGGRIGRAPENDIKVNDPALSRFQCRLFFRDGGLWIADLGSTNETLVNNMTVQESMLRSGDLITVGETGIRVLRSRLAEAEPEPVTAVMTPPTPATPDNAFDLGLGPGPREEDKPKEKKKQKRSGIPSFVWLLVAGLVLVAIVLWALKFLNDQVDDPNKGIALGTRTTIEAPPLYVAWERVEAPNDNVVRSRFVIENNTLHVTMNDLAANRKYTSDDTGTIALNKAQVDGLARTLINSPFFDTPPFHENRSSSGLYLTDLTIAVGTRANRVEVRGARRDEALPPGVADAIGKIDATVRNEFDMTPWRKSTAELKEIARSDFENAERLYSGRTAQLGNLHGAIQSYNRCILYLDTINEKPDYFESAKARVLVAQKDLAEELSDLQFMAEQAKTNNEYDRAATFLENIKQLIPDRTDPNYKAAENDLFSVNIIRDNR